MNIKSEFEIKLEELQPEYDDYHQYSQIPVNEAELTLPVIKNEELDEKESVKSELKEFEFVSVLEEEPIKDDVNLENETLFEKSNDQHSKLFGSTNDSADFASFYKPTAISHPQIYLQLWMRLLLG
ncbi:UNVERIFIED_CONTAM: hypothetical protein RMT77_014410 [Armadillidium vulgare]